MRRHFEVMKAVAFATYKEWAAYRSHSMVSIFAGPAYFLVQSFIWSSVYAQGGTMGGMSLEQMLVYFGVATLINYLIMDFADWNLQMLIHTGKYTTFILRPVSHIYFALSQKIGHRVLGLIFEFLPVYLILVCVFGITLLPAYAGWAILSVILGYLMMFLLDYCIGITGFWLVKTTGVRRMFLMLRNLCSGGIVPLILFPEAVQKLLFFLPFQFISYVPIRVFIGSYELGGLTPGIPLIVGLQLLYVVVTAGIAAGLSRLGERRYAGVGT